VKPVLVFDVMDTLVVDPFHDALPAFFGLSFEEYLAQKTPEAWPSFETARMSEPDFLGQMFLDRRSVDGPALRRTLAHAYRWIDGAEVLLQDLREDGYELHAMSNYPVWYHLVEAELGLSRYLEWSFVSWDTGVRKPNPLAFRMAQARLGRPAGELWLIDDQALNVAAARDVGWHGHLFEGVPGLRAALDAG
jgi:FMN hydrolase / 5-amino-6-(5-phospho-D-ribitylamino)uracil phosphatase